LFACVGGSQWPELNTGAGCIAGALFCCWPHGLPGRSTLAAGFVYWPFAFPVFVRLSLVPCSSVPLFIGYLLICCLLTSCGISLAVSSLVLGFLLYLPSGHLFTCSSVAFVPLFICVFVHLFIILYFIQFLAFC